jgi:hypothetical protein
MMPAAVPAADRPGRPGRSPGPGPPGSSSPSDQRSLRWAVVPSKMAMAPAQGRKAPLPRILSSYEVRTLWVLFGSGCAQKLARPLQARPSTAGRWHRLRARPSPGSCAGSGTYGTALVLPAATGGLVAHQLIDDPGRDASILQLRWRRSGESHGHRVGQPPPAEDHGRPARRTSQLGHGALVGAVQVVAGQDGPCALRHAGPTRVARAATWTGEDQVLRGRCRGGAGLEDEPDPLTPQLGSLSSRSWVTSTSPRCTLPESAGPVPAAQCMKVLLPDPDGPMTAVKLPVGSVMVTSRSAVTAPAPLP